jgi:hypothetical protein
LYILTFPFFDSRREDKRFCTEWWHALPEFSLLLISFWIKFYLLLTFPNTWTVFHITILSAFRSPLNFIETMKLERSRCMYQTNKLRGP